MLRHLPTPDHPDLIVGAEASDDALVWRRAGGRALVSTADFFTPIVDDPRLWGRIAAVNAVSDVYAMGGRPLFALNLVAWPNELLPLDLLAEVLAGGADAASDGDWVIGGGHTVDGPEPMYGMSMTGEVDEAALTANRGGQAGQTLVLTKPIGTGLLATAVKRNEPDATTGQGEIAEAYRVGVAEMGRLNDAAAAAAARAGATGATDVTGFGLLGHLHELCAASGVAAVVDAASVPLVPHAKWMHDTGYVAGGSQRNLEHLRPLVSGGDETTRQILADAQTSGGLLFSCPADAAEQAVAELLDTGHHAAVIGELVTPTDDSQGADRPGNGVPAPGAAGTIRIDGTL